jgi:hypothetical protein
MMRYMENGEVWVEREDNGARAVRALHLNLPAVPASAGKF